MPMQVHGLAPILPQQARVLILGSMPGQASLTAQQYYAHPRNAFWHIMLSLLNKPAAPLPPYTQRRQWLQQAGVALWDVYAACERQGSLDTAIVRDSAQVNDIGALLKKQPSITVIATNGGHARQTFLRHWRDLPVQTLFLPSTSPAHARMTLPQKLEAWTVLQRFLCKDIPPTIDQ